MSSLHQRKDSPYWVAAYTDADGRRLKKSTKSTNYEEAKRIAHEWEKAVQQAKKKRVAQKQHQTVIREIYDQSKIPSAVFTTGQLTTDNAPNQREIARMLQVSQATVSKALRGDRSISQEMRRKVHETAVQFGYHSNAYVNVLMSRIRAGKKLSDRGVIAMLVDAPSQANWHMLASYRSFHNGAIRRGKELGFDIEVFYLRALNMDAAKIDRILLARGIQGVILAPPYRGNRSLPISWQHYATVGVGFGREEQDFDRVAYDNLQNFVLAFNALLRLGYRKIGTVIDDVFTVGTYHGVKWYMGYLDCQDRLPREHRIPVCKLPRLVDRTGNIRDEMSFPYSQPHRRRVFEDWLEKWNPDALLTIAGYEYEWLEAMGLRVPQDIGLACLSEPINPEWAKIDEKAEEVGATALEWVTSKIARNEYGPSRLPKVTMVEGEWVSGETVKNQKEQLS